MTRYLTTIHGGSRIPEIDQDIATDTEDERIWSSLKLTEDLPIPPRPKRLESAEDLKTRSSAAGNHLGLGHRDHQPEVSSMRDWG